MEQKSLILASSSPRRKELLTQLGFTFHIVSPDIDETPQPEWPIHSIAEHLATEKCKTVVSDLSDPNQVVLAADCTVVHNNQLLEKPSSLEEAKDFLRQLSDAKHQVISGYAIYDDGVYLTGSVITEVTFYALDAADIDYYVEHYKVLDKAGGYGIQDWIGLVAIKEIKGSYTNIVGLPTAEIYPILKNINLRK